jgi:hypothetical protein
MTNSAAAVALQKTHANFLFQRLDATTERRLADVQTLGGPSKREFFRDGDK